jgi:hypothetical protein
MIFSSTHYRQVCLYKQNKEVGVNLGAKQKKCQGIKIKKVHKFTYLQTRIDLNGQELMVF